MSTIGTFVPGPMPPKTSGAKDEAWVHTSCDYCNANCPVIAHRVNGVVVKIEGDPQSPHSRGRLCSKGQSALMTVYDPKRVTSPLKRTNPDKGIGVDPKFVPISWDEGLDIVAQRLKKIHQTNPQQLAIATWDVNVMPTVVIPFGNAFGTTNLMGTSFSCGDAIHPLTYLINGTFQQEIDLDYCNYAILLGAQYGFNVGVNSTLIAQKMADARMRGMKVVVVDPVGTQAAAKADEWVPIRPGTDAALALAMVNLLINEYGLFDAEFLKQHTNGPYLIAADGSYMREKATRKALVWDPARNQAVAWDTPGVDPALEGRHTVAGAAHPTAFQLLKEHVKTYSPERASEITSVPPTTIRRIARDFGEAAKIGSKIVVDGKELPYRPAAIKPFNGVMRHSHATLTGLSVLLLNLVIGGMYVPGSYRGTNLLGPNGVWRDHVEEDGLLVPPDELGLHGENFYNREVRAPESITWREMLPFGFGLGAIFQMNMLDPKRAKILPYSIDTLIVGRHNLMMTGSGSKETAEALKKIPFIVEFSQELDETSEFADMVFPDSHALERLNIFPQRMRIACSPASGYFYWGIQQPVVDLPPGVRHWGDVMLELADRVGFRENLNATLNAAFKLKGDLALQGARPYDNEQISDHIAKATLGPDKGVDFLKSQGMATKKRDVDENYPMSQVKARFPIYFEVIPRFAGQVKAVSSELGVEVDTSDYVALPEWKACPAYDHKDPQFDLFGVNYKVPLQFQSQTARNPWLNEASERHRYVHYVMINAETANRKGIKDGDEVIVESQFGGKQRGRARVSEVIHPEVLGVAGVLGGWSQGKGVGRGKGVHYGSFLTLDPKRIDWISSAADECVRLKITKA
ncbi:MAG: molybdopterin-dependent oxidoreductase [Chloroflexi bacterium]|nr:molybdopterin-dependent oxidoreductase [Chloroflexota bacterium]